MHHDDFDSDLLDERKYRLDDLIECEKSRIRYTYDFGDDWEHDVMVERITPPEAGVKYSRCTDGARACPPEDVGSTSGYAEFLKAIRNPKHEEHATFLEWVGGKLDPEAFDLYETDVAIKDFKSMQAEMM